MLSLIITLAVLGLIVWLIVTYIPMVEPIRTIIIVIAAICALLYALRAFGLAGL